MLFFTAILRPAAVDTDVLTCTITQQDMDARGNFTIDFDEDKTCNGYEIIFRDDYAMQYGEGVEFQVYTVYRDPDQTHVPDGTEKVRYANEARSGNSYQKGDKTVFVYLTQEGRYYMLPSAEKLTVEKITRFNADNDRWTGSTWEGVGGNTVGKTYTWTVVEKACKGYTVQVERDGITFVITNTREVDVPDNPTPPKPAKPTLPQTGQLWWPVPLLMMGGLLFLVIGLFYRKRTSGEK